MFDEIDDFDDFEENTNRFNCECGNKISYMQVRYIGGCNDSGTIDIQCDKCDKCDKIHMTYVRNPFESQVLVGGSKIGFNQI